MGILAVRSQHSGRPLVVRYLVQGRSGQVESGLEGGSPIEEAVGGAGSGLIGLHLEGMRPGELFTVYQGYQEQEPRPHLEAWRTPREPGLLLQKRALTWNQRVVQPGPRGRRAPCSEGISLKACEGAGRTRPQADALPPWRGLSSELSDADHRIHSSWFEQKGIY